MTKESELKVAIVHEFLTKIGGAERVLAVLHEVFPDAPIYTFIYDQEGTKKIFDSCKIITSSLQKSYLKKKNPKLLLPKLAKSVEEFDLSEYDVVISSSNSFAHGVITKPHTFHLCYCHSPMRYAWDWYHEYMTENKIGFGIKGLYIRNVLHNVRIWDRVAADRVDKWIANSDTVAKRIKKYYRKDSITIHPPIDLSNIKCAQDLSDEYYVLVSRLEPYKKIDLAIDTFNENGKSLVIIGEGSERENLKEKAKKNIEFLGWQSDDSVYEYLRNSRALIFPGEEDFGITPIEAMACGRPVIAYKKGGVLETVKEGITGLFFDQQSPESLNSAILKLEERYLSFTPSNCRHQAEKYSKEFFKEKFNNFLDEQLKDHQKKYL